MNEQFSRTVRMIGNDGLARLRGSRVALFGVGGVGGYVAEALVRAGVGAIDLFDNDTVNVSNLNRQIIALHSTLDRPKVDVMAERLRDIMPDVRVGAHAMFYLPENADEVDLSQYDYVIDAIDTVAAKLELITRCKALKVPVICALGAGNKLDPTKLQVADIEKTSVCPLARVMRLELRKRHIRKVKVVFSTEPPVQTHADADSEKPQGSRHSVPGSMSFVPSAMGLIIAAEVVKDLLSAKTNS